MLDFIKDFAAFAKQTGNELVSSSENQGEFAWMDLITHLA